MKSSTFFVVGKGSTQSAEGSGISFKRYAGLATSKVLAVCPDKKTQDELLGYESKTEPEYVHVSGGEKTVDITFIVRTDPQAGNTGGVEITNKITFTLHNTPAYNSDKSSVQVIDKYANAAYISTETAKSKGKPVSLKGNVLRIDQDYHIACRGEADLTTFLYKYLFSRDAYEWDANKNKFVLRKNADDYEFKLEHIKDYFNGDFSELKQVLALQPSNTVTLLYGVRNASNGRQYQEICTSGDFIQRNNIGIKGMERMNKRLAEMKNRGMYKNTVYLIQNLKEYSVQPTDLTNPANDSFDISDSDMPW